MATAEVKPVERDSICPLPEGFDVIYHGNHLRLGPINFVQDRRNPREGNLAKHGPFFATHHPWMKATQFLVSGCQTLEELEDKAYRELINASGEIVEKVLLGGMGSQKLREAGEDEFKRMCVMSSPREYFQSIGEYFEDLIRLEQD